MKLTFIRSMLLVVVAISCVGCGARHDEVVDLNKVLDALVSVLDESGKSNATASPNPQQNEPSGTSLVAASGEGNAEVTSTAEIQAIEPSKQDPTKEKEFLSKYAAKLNEMHVMSTPVGVLMTPGGEIVGFQDPNENMTQDAGEPKEFTVTIDPSNKRLVASDNHGYHRPHGYHFSPGGMWMGYMLGSMMGRQGSYYSGPMSSARPNFNNTPMAPSDYHKSAASSVRTRSSSAATSSARARTGSKGFSFGK
jgi:hypothetical protein